ncbi:hypothetical protein ACFQOY_10925 [Enterococcus alcedinis]|nr:hypothetical protein [Enterococcus alcedinis]MBP2102257.1 hypothetical protein [Enterococcus alcedinis]
MTRKIRRIWKEMALSFLPEAGLSPNICSKNAVSEKEAIAKVLNDEGF